MLWTLLNNQKSKRNLTYGKIMQHIVNKQNKQKYMDNNISKDIRA